MKIEQDLHVSALGEHNFGVLVTGENLLHSPWAAQVIELDLHCSREKQPRVGDRLSVVVEWQEDWPVDPNDPNPILSMRMSEVEDLLKEAYAAGYASEFGTTFETWWAQKKVNNG